MKHILINLLLFSIFSLASIADVRALYCSSLLVTQSTLNDIDLLSEVENTLTDLYQEASNSDLIVATSALHKEVLVLIDKVLDNKELSDSERSSLTSLINTSTPNAETLISVKDDLTSRPIKQSSSFLEINSFSEVAPNIIYILPSTTEKFFTLSFTEQLLKSLLDVKLQENYRKAFLKAIKKGLQPANDKTGIKIMKTFEGVFFAEVKLIGQAGDKRIYGLVSDTHIEFNFLGTDSTSSSDSLHQRLKARN